MEYNLIAQAKVEFRPRMKSITNSRKTKRRAVLCTRYVRCIF